MSMGSRIFQVCKQKGLTQEALAKMIGVTKGAIGNYEKGISFPKVDIFCKLLEALEVDANFLYQDYANFSEYSHLNDIELSLLNDLRNADEYGRHLIRVVLDEQLHRVQDTGSVSVS